MNSKTDYQKIRKGAFFSLLLPLSFTLLFSVIFNLYDFKQILFPQHYASISQVNAAEVSAPSYILLDKIKLHYTGYDMLKDTKIKGHYYYYTENNVCYFVLLNEGLSNTAPKSVVQKNLRLHLIPIDSDFDDFLSNLSKDLDYNQTHLLEDTAPFVAVQSNSLFKYSVVAFLVFLICLLTTVANILYYLFILIYPDFLSDKKKSMDSF